jgi:hypothetical protein
MKYILLLCVIATSFVHASGSGRSTTPTLLDQIADVGDASSADAGGGNSRGSAKRKKRERGGYVAVASPQKALASPGKMGDVAKRLRKAGADVTNSPARRSVLASLQARPNPKIANDILLELLRQQSNCGKVLSLEEINTTILGIQGGSSVTTRELYSSAKDILEGAGGRAECFTAIKLDHIRDPQQMGDPTKARNKGRTFGGHTMKGWNQFEQPVGCTVFDNGMEKTICFRPPGKGAMPKSAWPVHVNSEDILRKFRNSKPFAKQPGAEHVVGKRCQLRMGIGTGEVIALGADKSQKQSAVDVAKTMFPFPLLSYPTTSGDIVVAQQSVQSPKKGGVMRHIADLTLTQAQLLKCLADAKASNNKTFVDFKTGKVNVVRDVTKEVHVKLGFTGKPRNPFWIWETSDCEKLVQQELGICSVGQREGLLKQLQKLSLEKPGEDIWAGVFDVAGTGGLSGMSPKHQASIKATLASHQAGRFAQFLDSTTTAAIADDD